MAYYRLSDEERAYRARVMRRDYPTMVGRDIDKAQGWPIGTTSTLARKLGVKHTEEVERTIVVRQANSLVAANKDRDVNLRRIAVNKRIRRLEELRVLSGEPQKTRIAIRKLSPRIYKAKWHLTCHYKYIPDEDNPLTLYYDDSTLRLLKKRRNANEAYYTETYRFTFLPLPVEEEADEEDEPEEQVT